LTPTSKQTSSNKIPPKRHPSESLSKPEIVTGIDGNEIYDDDDEE
jgi:hypothetical protein